MEQKQVERCYFFPIGKCRDGEKCRFLHTAHTNTGANAEKERKKEVPVKTPIQLLGRKKTSEYLKFSQAHEIVERVRKLEGLLLDMYEFMDHSDVRENGEQRGLACASWIFASNKMDNLNTETVGETLAFLQSPFPVNTLLKESFIAADNTNKLMFLLLTDKPDVTSHLWCNEETLGSWHLTLQTNLSLNAGLLRTQHSSVEESLTILRFILLKIGVMIDDVERKRVFGEKIRLVFALAAFASYHFTSIRPYMDGNERLARLLVVNILDAVCPVPFPLLSPSHTREKYRSAHMEKDPTSLMLYLLDCAIFHSKKSVYF